MARSANPSTARVQRGAAVTEKKPAGRPPERIRVEVRRRDDVEDILWPKGWPLPEPGTILHGDVLAGWVEHCEYNIPAGRIIVVLRP